MRKKSKLLLVAMALGLAFIAPASATDFNTVPLDMYPTTLPGAQFSSVSNSFTSSATVFHDRWTFDVSGPGAKGAANASAFATVILDGQSTQNPLSLQLILKAWDGNDYNTLLFDSGVNTFTPGFKDLVLAPHTGGAPNHGFYSLELLGNTPPGQMVATQYSGQLQVAAIPEPSTYAVLLGGLLLIGWQARRGSI